MILLRPVGLFVRIAPWCLLLALVLCPGTSLGNPFGPNADLNEVPPPAAAASTEGGSLPATAFRLIGCVLVFGLGFVGLRKGRQLRQVDEEATPSPTSGADPP